MWQQLRNVHKANKIVFPKFKVELGSLDIYWFDASYNLCINYLENITNVGVNWLKILLG